MINKFDQFDLSFLFLTLSKWTKNQIENKK